MQTQYETAINDSGVFYALIAEIFEQPDSKPISRDILYA